MICEKCGMDREGGDVEIVTGKLLDSRTSRDGVNTLKNLTFGEFQKMSLWFCQDCWREHQREGDETRMKGSAIFFVVSLMVFGLGSLIQNSTCSGLGLIFGLLGLFGAIWNGLKRARAHYSELSMQLAEPNSIFDEFKDFIPALVYKARRETYYWEAHTWQDWMDKKPGSPRGTYQSKA